jgi:hypothetical protein
MLAHINRLTQMAQKDPQLLAVARNIASENGVKQRGEERQDQQQ